MSTSTNLAKTIFVTGGTGFVGSYLLRYLVDRGYGRIRAVRRPGSRLDLVGPVVDRIEWLEGDVLDIFFLDEAMQGVDQVYHCAALISFDADDERRLMQTNVDGTANVVNAALDAGIEKLVHVSSVAALGRTRNGETLSEKSIWQRSRYNTKYAISKYLAEQEVWRGMAEGLRVGVVNPSVILGSGRWEEGPLRLLHLAWRNFPLYSTGATGFVDVRDVARFMILLMESDVVDRRYLLSGANLSYRDLLQRIAHCLDRRPPFVRVDPWAQGLAWRLALLPALFNGRRPLITRETARNASRTFYFDNSQSITDFDFQYTPIEETLAIACRQFSEAAEEGFSVRIMPL